MEWPEIEQRLQSAVDLFMEYERELLARNASERSMTHKLAEWLQNEFEDWDVDCEYNRTGDIPKRLRYELNSPPISPEDDIATTVFPDIIVHKRGAQENLLVIEAKKTGNDDNGRDRRKVIAFLTDEGYLYRFGVLLTFHTRPSHITFKQVVITEGH